MIARTPHVLGALALTSLVTLAGCARGCTSSRPPIHLNPSMDDQPKVRTQTASTFFYDGSSMRLPVPGTVPIGGLKEDTAFFTGKGADGQIFDVITNGQGLMASYRWPIPPADRWAIIAYVRELERKRLASAADGPAGIK